LLPIAFAALPAVGDISAYYADPDPDDKNTKK